MLFLYDTSISSNINCYSRNSSFKLIHTLIMHKSAIIMHCLGKKTHPHAFADTEYVYTQFGMRWQNDIVLGPTHHSEVLGSEGLCPPVSTVHPAVQNRAQTSCQVCRFVNLLNSFSSLVSLSLCIYFLCMYDCTKCTFTHCSSCHFKVN